MRLAVRRLSVLSRGPSLNSIPLLGKLNSLLTPLFLLAKAITPVGTLESDRAFLCLQASPTHPQATRTQIEVLGPTPFFPPPPAFSLLSSSSSKSTSLCRPTGRSCPATSFPPDEDAEECSPLACSPPSPQPARPQSLTRTPSLPPPTIQGGSLLSPARFHPTPTTMADVESIKSPGSSPSRPKKGPDPLVDVAVKPTKFQVCRVGREGKEGRKIGRGVVCSRGGAEGFRVVLGMCVLEGSLANLP